MSSANNQVTGVTPFVRGFSNYAHTYSGPYSETLINYTYPTNHVRPHAVSSRSNGDAFTYDANGNMTQRVQNNVTWTQTFDAENHLTSVSDGTTTTQYVYDGNGNRVKRTVGTTSTVYVAGMEIELHSGTEDHRTIYYAAGGAFRVIGGSNAGLYYRHTDHLGSTSVLSDSSGNKVANSDVVFAPFGETRVGTLSTLTDFGFTGQRLDRTDGLMYYGARYYLPGLNRFISPDTIVPGMGDPQNLNRYSYTRNNPVKRIDPTGHRDCDKLPGDCGKPVDTSGPAPDWMVKGEKPGRPGPNFREGEEESTQSDQRLREKDDRFNSNDSDYSEWYSGKISGCTMCHWATGQNHSRLTNDQLALVRSEYEYRQRVVLSADVAAGAVLAFLYSNGMLRPNKSPSIEDYFAQPSLLEGKTMQEVQDEVGYEPEGWKAGTLGDGTHEGQGWTLHELNADGSGSGFTDKYLQYHPGGEWHFDGNPYWKLSSSLTGTVRFLAGK